MSNIKLLVPHGADGGMPSHHMVFMASVAFMVYFSSKRLSFVLVSLSVISGIGQVSAGIHYTSDVVAGILLAGVVTLLYVQLSRVFSGIFLFKYLG
jgi:membrane-associated phospholipid phosphatase